MTPDLLSAIVLLDLWSAPDDAEAALLALAVQEWSKLQVILVCNETQIAAARAVCANQPWTKSMQIEIIALPDNVKDNNATRLNTALNACEGQFVTVLQTNDIVYGFAFQKLIDLLKKSAEAVAIGGTRNANFDRDDYMVSKSNHSRAGKKTFDVWFDEDSARNFVIDKSKLKSDLAAEPSLDYFSAYFLLLTLSLNNEFNFSLASESMFERRESLENVTLNEDVLSLQLRARSKIIDWKTSQFNSAISR